MKKFLGVVVLCIMNMVVAYAQEAKDLGQIVVTPFRYAEVLGKAPANVSVISAADIKRSNAQTLVDVLRPVAGITVRDWYGNGTKAAVDMAGFGEQAALNVLVLLDGRRVNDIDLSGVDWSQIPLDQVERIEVIRGGSAGVLYGDNASSGVINIITKKGFGKPKVELEARYGSYDMNAQKMSVGGGIDDKFSYWFNGGRDSTRGYRYNSFSKAEDFAGKVAYDITDMLSVHADAGFHAASFGMPGALWQNHIDREGRRYARYGRDHANNKDFYVVAGIKESLTDAGVLDIDFNYRGKDTDSYFLTSGLYTQRNRTTTVGATPKYTLTKEVMEHDNKLIIGADAYRTFYNSDKYNSADDQDIKNYTNINKMSLAGYGQDEYSVTDKLVAVGGYRYEAASYAFGYHDYSGWNPDIDKKVKPNMRAFNTGFVYTYQEDSNAFVDVGKSFRFPEADEFTYNDASWQQQLNTELRPQSSINYQVGVRHKFNNSLKGALSVFRMNLKDELYYNSNGGPLGMGQNQNYDRTIHQGLEAALEAKLNDKITTFGNYTFTDAYFDGGVYSKNEIPLVPHHKVSAGLRFLLLKDLALNTTATYVGQRRVLNDQANAVSRINGYMVVDASLAWHCKDWTTTLGVNNLLNKKYAEYAGYGFNSSTGISDKFYYPSPERNFTMDMKYSF